MREGSASSSEPSALETTGEEMGTASRSGAAPFPLQAAAPYTGSTAAAGSSPGSRPARQAQPAFTHPFRGSLCPLRGIAPHDAQHGYLTVGWTLFLARRGRFFFTAGARVECALCGGSTEAAPLMPLLARMRWLGTELLLPGEWGDSGSCGSVGEEVSGEGPRSVLPAQYLLKTSSGTRECLLLERRLWEPCSWCSMRYTSSVTWLTRSNWASSISKRERSRWRSASTSKLSRVLSTRLSPSSWLEEVEALELSEAALGVGPRMDLESLESRDGSGSMPSNLTLWRNWKKRTGDSEIFQELPRGNAVPQHLPCFKQPQCCYQPFLVGLGYSLDLGTDLK